MEAQVTGTDLLKAGAMPVLGLSASFLYAINEVASTVIAVTGAIMGIHAVVSLIRRYLRKP